MSRERPKNYRVRTESGSIYLIDNTNLIWHREMKGPKGGHVRTKSGNMSQRAIPRIGKRLNIFCSPLVQGTTGRLISTSEVVSFDEVTEG